MPSLRKRRTSTRKSLGLPCVRQCTCRTCVFPRKIKILAVDVFQNCNFLFQHFFAIMTCSTVGGHMLPLLLQVQSHAVEQLSYIVFIQVVSLFWCWCSSADIHILVIDDWFQVGQPWSKPECKSYYTTFASNL